VHHAPEGGGGRLFQPQNLPRPTMKQEQIDFGIDAMKLDAEDLLFDNVAELCSSAVRGALIASPGHKLVVSDLSNIEGRVLAWLAGEEWKTEAFKQFDAGVGHDLYKLAYAKSFNKEAEDVTKDERQIGKVQELALGYQGSVGAFSSMAALYGVFLPEDEVKRIVEAWRKAHSAVVALWYDLERAVKDAIRAPNKRFTVRDLSIGYKDNWLRIKLPSGRYLCYPNAGLNEGSIVYEGVNQYTKKWETIETYGGKLVENVVQAVARDVLASGMFRAEAAGYAVCLHVHDELITETPDTDEYSVDELSRIMSTNPGWSLGLPLAAAGFETRRYKKD
jgi:DNA polymerase